MENNKIKPVWIIGGIVILVVGLLSGYFYGKTAGYAKGFKQGDTVGYERAQDDAKKLQEELARKAAEDAAKAANPFQAVNPLEGITANPFDAAKKALNPFAE